MVDTCTAIRHLLEQEILFLLIGNTSSVICAGCHVAIWILFSNRKSLECDVCALNVALRSQKKLFLTTAWNILGVMDGAPSVSNKRNKVLDLL